MCPLAIDPPIINEQSIDTLKKSVDDLVDNELYLNNDFLKMLQEDYYFHHIYKSPTYYFNQTKFFKLLNEWNDKTMFSSNANEIISSHPFHEIVKMGITAIPFILEQLKQKPGTLVWALNKITNSKISEQKISVEEASRLWVQWGKKNKII